MMAKLYNALAVFSIATLLATSGFVAYLAGSGRLEGNRVRTLAAVLRGELDDYVAAAPTPEAQDRPEKVEQTHGSAAEEIQATQHAEQVQSLKLERARQDLAARQRLLDQTLQYLLSEREQISDAQKAGTPRQVAPDAAADRGFQQEVELVAGLQPKQAKEHVVRMWKKKPADAVRLMRALDAGRGKRILAQFKTGEELEIMSQLLEQLRSEDPADEAHGSGRTGGAATP